MCDVSRVKRKNAQRMMKLGWQGVEKRLTGGRAGGGGGSDADDDGEADDGYGGDAAVS